MEALQLAQMLADINDLHATQDQTASKALVTSNETLGQKTQLQPSLHHRRSATEGHTTSAPAGSGRMTDKFGRRIFSPPLTRNNSGTPLSVPGTPRGDRGPDTDIDKASTLLSLYEIRNKLKEQDNSSLNKAREKIAALAAKQEQKTPTPSQTPRSEPKISYPRKA
ncbi:hypothetical protein F5Y15DRAFT_19441 [Xylariaceae sp. FL0016]|nr:hypothetical protein F5Y15DRAFT_19441 [Xylariaceae sp. FL0016]